MELVDPPLHVLIPVYNEDQRIYTAIIESILARGWHVIVVDDGSVLPVRKVSEGMTLIRHRTNLGQGAALETGMEYARGNNVRLLAHMDGDGQHEVSDIDQMIAPVVRGEADITLGSRFLDVSSSRSIPRRRYYLLLFARLCNHFFTGVRMSDAHNGFRALNHKAIQDIRLRTPGREHASEFVWRARKMGMNIKEMPVHVHYNVQYKPSFIPLYRLIGLGLQLIVHRCRGYRSGSVKVLAERTWALQHIE